MLKPLRKLLKHWFRGFFYIEVQDSISPKKNAQEVVVGQENAIDSSHRIIEQVINNAARYDECLFERARTQWQFGDWDSLVRISHDSIICHPERAKLALLAAAGHLQTNNMGAAKQFIRDAQDWGCSKKLVTRILIAGVHNSLGRAAGIAGESQRSSLHFENSLKTGMPNVDIRLLARARTQQQLGELALQNSEINFSANTMTLDVQTVAGDFNNAGRLK